MIKQEILSKLANNEELTQEEIEFMVMRFLEVDGKLIDVGHRVTTISVILEADEDLYYEVIIYEPNYVGDTKYQQPRYQQPRRFKRTLKTAELIEVFEPCDD